MSLTLYVRLCASFTGNRKLILSAESKVLNWIIGNVTYVASFFEFTDTVVKYFINVVWPNISSS